jgi:hypothetical protein
MNIELPPPTEHELKKYNKAYYFDRIMDSQLNKQLGITHYQLADWISENYNSILLNNKPMVFKKA